MKDSAIPDFPRQRYEWLRPDEIESVRHRAPIAYVPWGALEYHGLHAPVGLDGLKAHGLCLAAVRRTGGVVLPPIFHAASTLKTHPVGEVFRQHSMEHSIATVQGLARELLGQLADDGFRVIVLVAGHIGRPHFDVLKAEAAELQARRPDLRVWAGAETDLLSAVELEPNHAGLGEIALMLALAPGSIALANLPDTRPLTLADDAVSGPDPRNGTAELGRQLVELFVTRMCARVKSWSREINFTLS